MSQRCPNCDHPLPEKRTHTTLDMVRPVCGTGPIPTGVILAKPPLVGNCRRCEKFVRDHPVQFMSYNAPAFLFREFLDEET